MIDGLGKNLNIAIMCNYNSHHNWMSFLLWYSLTKNLPEAKIYLFCTRNLMSFDYFQWARKCKISLYFHSLEENKVDNFILEKVQKPILKIPADYVCLRDLDECKLVDYFEKDDIYEINDELSCDCKENKFLPFVSYKIGWGKFILSNWINKLDCPFRYGLKFDSNNGYFNENKISKLWGSASSLFQKIRG